MRLRTPPVLFLPLFFYIAISLSYQIVGKCTANAPQHEDVTFTDDESDLILFASCFPSLALNAPFVRSAVHPLFQSDTSICWEFAKDESTHAATDRRQAAEFTPVQSSGAEKSRDVCNVKKEMKGFIYDSHYSQGSI